ncbi:DNA-binding IclR family transcriptional regulator [Povalibacter uvarum]|uniref:DNA-binding IclR family transcriptional regulator n=1 Tax=Povalibacter uvarum TaxID=732238 RepID=A0A841HP41_9GAMM|nr:IclR family transcriptional regulator [Povalibacter uvarum]MBB6094533.1 DNA-binding IclR family transcriptional regulator [Povalibacter uvarum]
MRNNSRSIEASAKAAKPSAAPAGSQTLLRGLDLLEAVTAGPVALAELSTMLQLNRSTVHRLASALVDRGYLKFVPREGYMLGAKLLELGYSARQQIDLPRVARPVLEKLAEQTEDTVHLGLLDGNKALYVDKIPGRRRIDISSRVGERHPLCSTGLGKALLLDSSRDEWRAHFEAEAGRGHHPAGKFQEWVDNMRTYAAGGYSFDLEENEDRIRCVGAPVRDESGRIVAAISVASVAQYMDDARMNELIGTVTSAADEISKELGWVPVPRGKKK